MKQRPKEGRAERSAAPATMVIRWTKAINGQASAEGEDDKNEDAGTNGAPGDGEHMTATNGRDTSSTKGNGAMTPQDCDAETILQKDPRGGDHPPPRKKNYRESMDK
jgi:hypothetical protein